MARPGSKEGSRAKSGRKPPKDKKVRTEEYIPGTDSDDNNEPIPSSGSTGRSRAQPQAKQQVPYPAMRKIFTAAQQASNVNECIEKFMKLFQACDKPAAVNELKACIRIAARSEPDNPHTKPLMDFICRILLLMSKQEKDDSVLLAYAESESSDQQSDDESDEAEADELSVLCSGPSSGRSGRKAAATKKSSKKTAAKKKDKKKKPVAQRRKNLARLTTLDIVLRDVLIPGMDEVTLTININCLSIIRRVMAEVEDAEEQTYNKLRDALVEQITRKNVNIRAAAIKALHRFQDLRDDKDVICAALRFHMNSDPSHKVRQAAMQVIQPTSKALPFIIKRTRDVKEICRKTAYTLIASKIHVKALSISQRLAILKNGMTEGNPSVKKIIEKHLIVNWLKACNENVAELLALLDTESDPKTVDQMLHLIFRAYMEQTQDGKTKLHLFVKQFKFQYLDQRKLLTKKPLDVENAFLWRSLCYFLKSQGDLDPLDAEVEPEKPADNYQSEIDDLFAKIELKEKERQAAEAAAAAEEDIADEVIPGQSTSADHTADQSGPTPPKKTRITQAIEVELLDYILPQLPHICYYIKKFTKKIADSDFDELELADLDYVYEQLVSILMLVDIGDKAQETILLNMIRAVVMQDKLVHKMKDVVAPLMHVIVKNVYKNPEQLLKYTQELTQEIHNSIYEAAEAAEQEREMEVQSEQRTYSIRETNDIELSYAKACVDLESGKDELEQHLRDQNYIEAEKVKQKLKSLEKERDYWYAERQAARGFRPDDLVIEDGVTICEPHVPSSQILQEKTEPQIQDNPIKLKQCLLIFSACLQYGKFREIESVIQSHVDRIVFSGLLSEQPGIRLVSVKILGNCCLISKDFAKKYFALIVQVIQHDTEGVAAQALKALFDIICVHGITEMRNSLNGESEETSSSTNGSAETHNRSQSAGAAAGQDDEDEEMEDDDNDEGEAGSSSRNNRTTKSGRPSKANASSSTSSPEISSDQARQFEENLSDLLMSQLASEDMPIHKIAMKGVAKLIFLDRIKEDHPLALQMIKYVR